MKRLDVIGFVITSGIVLAMAAGMRAQQRDPVPARFVDGSIPQTSPNTSPNAASGGDVVLSVAVSEAGAVGQIDVLRTTPPYTDIVIEAVKTWRFTPALDAKQKPMATRVLVDAVFGPPSIMVPTVGTPPKDVTTGDTRVPFPAQTNMPLYPVNARAQGTVLVETSVERSGRVSAATAVRSAPPFDGPAIQAARSWTFRPATGADLPPATYAYLLFVFRQPNLSGPAVAPAAR
jgi:TonB family protein